MSTVAPGYERNRFSFRSGDARVGGTRLRRVLCTVEASDDRAHSGRITIAIGWVARSAKEAEGFLPGAEGVVEVADRLIPGDTLGIKLIMRSGRYLVGFDRDTPEARELAATVHRTLRNR